MPRIENKHGEFKTIPFKPAHIAFLLYMGREVYPDEGITMEQFQDENSQVQQALEKLLRNRKTPRFAAVGEKGKEYVDASTGEVIAHDDPRRKRLDEIDRKKPGSIRHFAGGGFLTDSDGAIRFDDKTDMGKANVASVLGNSDMTTPSAAPTTSTMTPATPQPATAGPMQQTGFSTGSTSQPRNFQTDSTGALSFSDNSALGQANVQAAGIGPMGPSPSPLSRATNTLLRPATPALPSVSNLTTPTPAPAPLSTGLSSSMGSIPSIGGGLLTDKAGSIRFDDTSDIGRQNTAFAMTPLAKRKRIY
jgi:hypothetical protein